MEREAQLSLLLNSVVEFCTYGLTYGWLRCSCRQFDPGRRNHFDRCDSGRMQTQGFWVVAGHFFSHLSLRSKRYSPLRHSFRVASAGPQNGNSELGMARNFYQTFGPLFAHSTQRFLVFPPVVQA